MVLEIHGPEFMRVLIHLLACYSAAFLEIGSSKRR
jgi:hypothetical protein